jgi:hypothetical protein
MDFAQTGALTTADLFKNFPAANIMNGDIVKRHPELPPLRHEELPPPSGS